MLLSLYSKKDIYIYIYIYIYSMDPLYEVNNPGRIVVSVNNHTEKLSAYVDEFLRPIAEKLLSYIQDTTHFNH